MPPSEPSRGLDIVSSSQRPYYDRDRRELWLGNELVKRFTQRAPDQHLLLCTFEDRGWPARIENPLALRNYRSLRKLRLNRAIYRLNRHQQKSLLRFRGDGTGEGVLWEVRIPGHRRSPEQR